MKALPKNSGRTDQMLGAMADILSSFALPGQQWLSEVAVEDSELTETSSSLESGQHSEHWDLSQVLLNSSGGFTRVEGLMLPQEESYSVAGSDGSISTSVASIQPQPSSSSAPSSPGSRRSVSTLKKWLTNPVRKLSVGSAAKVERQVRRLESKPKRKSVDEGRKSVELVAPGHQEEAVAIIPDAKELTSGGLADIGDCWDESEHQEVESLDLQMQVPPLSPTEKPPDGDTCSHSSDVADTEEERRSALEKSMYVLKELLETERMYVNDLSLIVEGYMATMNSKGVPEDMKGKDKIVFGNIHQIYDWHKDYFLGELEKCVHEPERLADLFIKHERRLHMYVVYCQNKPKSEHIVSEYIETYFEELKQQLGHRLQLNDLLIKPVQRIMKYQLLLKDFLKYYTKAAEDTTQLEKAVEVMCFVPKRCNDMINLGRLQGFEGKITAQGKLLQQDTFSVMEQDCGFLSRARERRVFLFEQIVIFSEPIDKKKGFSLPGYNFKSSIKVSCLGLEDSADGDPCRFVLTSRGADGSLQRFVLQARNPEIRQAWVSEVGHILETQKDFLNALQSPIEYIRRESKSNSLGRGMRPPVIAPSPVRPRSSASMDRSHPPNLRSYNASLPSLYLPCQSAHDPQVVTLVDPQLSPHMLSPQHIHLDLGSEILSNGLQRSPEVSGEKHTAMEGKLDSSLNSCSLAQPEDAQL
ncbi:rho guanine nucleotide exchange factor 25 isoform X1 [Erpetoichthys calabaricus]|uniref:rho guanine nucleotide exchange factor 25 isoform X1 n=1 Tax=Erpetoichthys calabaricus TaxID=27687 RepID=UPI00109F0946|nr:rho guanine nucleotide exchange factor 25 isoform X1 [Erpetoichthys calabaricus]